MLVEEIFFKYAININTSRQLLDHLETKLSACLLQVDFIDDQRDTIVQAGEDVG